MFHIQVGCGTYYYSYSYLGIDKFRGHQVLILIYHVCLN